ncbi:MAG TPA: hypothetical protein VH540_08645 [Ktedonobacterales bacterium]|jgi:hypothetical protein
MQYRTSGWQAQQEKTSANAPLLPALAALLIILALIGLWGTAHAAPQSGANTPNLNIVGLNNNIVTLSGENWEANSTVALSFSTSTKCQPANALHAPNNIALVTAQGTFRVEYPWPASTPGGPFYFCASGRSADHTTAPNIYTPQAIVVSLAGTVTFAPGSAPTPPPTNTPPAAPTSASTPANAATATAQATTAANQSPTVTAQPTRPTKPTATVPRGDPGNKGASASNKSSGTILFTFAAVVALCILVFMLLIYLIHVYKHGRQTP